MASPFLTTEWKNLAMFNYVVDREWLQPYVPYGTELDTFNNTCYLTLLGLYFQNAKVKGRTIPFHHQFEMINLRFYVRHKYDGQWRKGVVFIKEINPKPLITFVARQLFKEAFSTHPTQHEFQSSQELTRIIYRMKAKKWHSLCIEAEPQPQDMMKGSVEEFITERYYGFSKLSPTETRSFRVAHPRWKIHPVKNYDVHIDFGEVYGEQFNPLQNMQPQNVLLTGGSKVKVFRYS